jgi:hypothetical protein
MGYGKGNLNSQTITIMIDDSLKNWEFQAERLNLQLNNKYLVFGRAFVSVRTILSATDLIYGFRYFLYTYFYTCGFVIISTLSLINCTVCVLVAYLFMIGCCYNNQDRKVCEKKVQELPDLSLNQQEAQEGSLVGDPQDEMNKSRDGKKDKSQSD